MLDQTLLPLNSTPFERAVETALKLDCQVATGDLWNPATCPAALLPWLAWALSVDTWDAAWPDAIQRRVIANSPVVHRAKGTRAAVAAALDGLMVEAGIIEWWQPGGSGVAGTFIIRAYASARWTQGAALITPELIAAIRAMVTASAPVSRPFELQIGIGTAADIGVAVVAAPALKITTPTMALSCDRAFGSPLGMSACLTQALRINQMSWELAP